MIGAGVMGLLAAWLCAGIRGADVTIFDIDPGRADVAATLGLGFTAEEPEGVDADLIIHASGHPEGLRTALVNAAVEAVILEVSWYGARSVVLPLGEAFHSRRLTIRSTQVGRIPPHRAARWDHRRRMRTALDLLRDERLDALVSDESAFDDLPQTLETLSHDPAGALCHRIRYGDPPGPLRG